MKDEKKNKLMRSIALKTVMIMTVVAVSMYYFTVQCPAWLHSKNTLEYSAAVISFLVLLPIEVILIITLFIEIHETIVNYESETGKTIKD